MSLYTLTLMECPYCNGRIGQIAINVPALNTIWHEFPTLKSKDINSVIHTIESHGAVVFNSAGVAEGPCEHLVHISIDFDRSGWAGCFAYKCPNLDDGADYFWDVLPFTTAPALVPKTAHDRLSEVRLSWQVGEKDGKPVRLDVVGSAWFAEDRVRFIEELRALEDRRQEAYKTVEGTEAFNKLREQFRRYP